MNFHTQIEEKVVMEVPEIRDQIESYNQEAILWNGLDRCILGVSADGRAVYSIELILEHFVNEGMDAEEASEYFYYNLQGANVGPFTPIHIYQITN